MGIGVKKEDILKTWLDTKPVVKSMYGLYGNPPMWETFKDSDLTLYSRPGKTITRSTGVLPWEEVDGFITNGCATGDGRGKASNLRLNILKNMAHKIWD